MENEQLQQLEQRLSVLEGGAALFETIKALVAKVDDLETMTALLGTGFLKVTEILHGWKELDRRQRAELRKQQELLSKRSKPEPEPESEPPKGGKPN